MKWIKSEETKPEIDVTVLIYDYSLLKVGYFHGAYWYVSVPGGHTYDQKNDPEYWCAIPELPK